MKQSTKDRKQAQILKIRRGFAITLGLVLLLGPSISHALPNVACSKDRHWNGTFGGKSRDCPDPGSTCCYNFALDVDQPVFINGSWHITGRTTGSSEVVDGGTVDASDEIEFVF